MKKIIIDTETVALTDKSKIKDADAIAQKLGYESFEVTPLVFQLAYKFEDSENNISKIGNTYGQPDFPLTIDASEVTGISKNKLNSLTLQPNGSNIKISDTTEFKEIQKIIEDKNVYVIGQNVDYDIEVLRRDGLDLSDLKKIDTLQLSRHLNKDFEYHRLSYLNHALGIYDDLQEKMVSDESIVEISRGISGSHSALFDITATDEILNLFIQKLDLKDKSVDEIYAELHRLSITPFIIEEIPYGIHKGKLITEVDDNSLLYLYNIEDKGASNINLRFTLEEEFKHRGGLNNILNNLTDFMLDKVIKKDKGDPDLIKTCEEIYRKRLGLTIEDSNDGVYRLLVGKYKGKTIDELCAEPKGKDYLKWAVLNMSFPTEIKQEINDKLSGKDSSFLEKNLLSMKKEERKEEISKKVDLLSDDMIDDFLDNMK